MKKTLAWFSAFVLILSFMFTLPLSVNAESTSIRNRRVVSVMYDDSGSMVNDTWIGASYAMQAFTAMLNKEDSLYISYMSENESETPGEYSTRKIDLGNPQAEVDTIRAHDTEGKTPVETLKNSFTALMNDGDTDPNTEYWLVAFTDGGFNDGVTKDDVTKLLNTYSEMDMPNGSKANIFFMAIGAEGEIDNYTPSDSGKSNIDIRKATSTSAITDNIFSMAAKISGRYQATGANISMPDKKTVTVASDLPLFNIGVIIQNSDVKISHIQAEDGTEVPIKSNVSIKAPGLEIPAVNDDGGPSEAALNMKGSSAIAGKENATLPKGKFTITFSGELSDKDIAVLLEPAISIKLVIERDGNVVDPSDKYVEENILNLTGIVVEAGTDNPIDLSLIPSDVVFETGYRTSSNSDKSETLSYKDLTLTTDETELYTSIILPGFNPITETITITPSKIPDYVIVPGVDSYSLSQSNLRDSDKDPVIFTLYRDGEKISYEEAKSLDFKPKLNGVLWNDWMIDCETELLSDGTFACYPRYKNDFVSYWISFLTLPFGNSIRCGVGSVQSDKVPMTIWWAFPSDFIINILQMLGWAWLLRVLTKKKFPFAGKLELRTVRFHKNDDKVRSPEVKPIKNGILKVLNPFRPVSMPLESGIVLYPMGFRKNCVTAQYKMRDRVAFVESTYTESKQELKSLINRTHIGAVKTDKEKNKPIEKTIKPGKAICVIKTNDQKLIEYGITARPSTKPQSSHKKKQ